MFIENLSKLFVRDLNKLKEEISLYKKEENIWIIGEGISNSSGNLSLHLIGNLNAFIAAEIGKTGYVRNRPEEFSLKNISREVLLKNIDQTISAVTNSLKNLNEDDYDKIYPIKVFEYDITYQLFLMHLSGHLTYHLGQINYHRRLLDN